ncbi:ABC transporter permease [Photobacterium rosenbergii]|uniref:ABC transporter permease n=1 Tax=Photobacterium rosenbergii TaxID=294936 RepID=A0ABU3ZF17_9GAMM|nr:ABC transporter permease [Photobacterium rosenbergii]MDV5168523.1 ABC transporter permease [Photobacterium rosenbergii]
MRSAKPPIIEVDLDERITSSSVAELWHSTNKIINENPASKIKINASKLTFIDNTGIAFLYDLRHRQRDENAAITIENLSASLQLLIPNKDIQPKEKPASRSTLSSFIEGIGKATNEQLVYTSIMFHFLARCIKSLSRAVVGKEKIRWIELLSIATQAGANAIPIVLLIGFLMGVIIAFEIGLVAQQFGAVLFVVDGIGISMFRELGPLMTAIIFAGRTGAAFAAEIGTKKINEEINALYTFGIDPISFLVLPRLLASLMVLPLLTVMADIIGVIGGAIVLLKFNIGFVQFYQQLINSLAAWDFSLGLIKAFTFAFIVAAIGCERGLTTGVGASAVGLSATSAVVSSIIWIVIVDGFFAVLTS